MGVVLKMKGSSPLSVHEATGEELEEKPRASVVVDLFEDPVHERKFLEDGLRIQAVVRIEPRRVWVGEFIRPLVEVSLHMAGGQLCPPFV